MEQLQAVFRDVFFDDELMVTPETTADDVEGWDSLKHVTLIVNVEKRFGIKFRSGDIAKLKSVGDLDELVGKQLAIKGT